jgi:hypothetical protein
LRAEVDIGATHARLTVPKSLISLGISTKITYPNLTSFNPVTEGFTEDFTEGCKGQMLPLWTVQSASRARSSSAC